MNMKMQSVVSRENRATNLRKWISSISVVRSPQDLYRFAASLVVLGYLSCSSNTLFLNRTFLTITVSHIFHITVASMLSISFSSEIPH